MVRFLCALPKNHDFCFALNYSICLFKKKKIVNSGRLTPHNQTIAGRTSSSDGQLTTTFHITALGQAHIDLTMSQIRDSVKAYSAEETIQADHLAKFTDQEIVNIKSLGAEEVHISGNVG